MFKYTLENTDWFARAWEIETDHGKIQTPIFMPNTYHLYLRPGDEVVKHFWWAHRFQNYHGPILTDSGWFQVFSLGQTRQGDSLVKITEDWVHFRSFIDGSKHYFSPEKVMDIQSNIGADIIMAFDECAPGQSTHSYARAAMERTHRWAQRSKNQWMKNNEIRKSEWLHEQALFWIVQGVIFDDLRKESAKFIKELDTPGISIGWLSVGESKEDMYRILDIMKQELPENKPRYLMGVGTPEDLIEWIYRWVDMFDCVLPTRVWRHGKAFGTYWSLNIKKSVSVKFVKTTQDDIYVIS